MSAVPEREGSKDARLLVDDNGLKSVIEWFIQRGHDRWISDVIREVSEEALLEGEPVFNTDVIQSLLFTFQRVVTVTLPDGELRSQAATNYATTYLWWIFGVSCSAPVFAHLRRSRRVLVLTDADVARKASGDVVLTATLWC
jgi:hypothetical protein